MSTGTTATMLCVWLQGSIYSYMVRSIYLSALQMSRPVVCKVLYINLVAVLLIMHFVVSSAVFLFPSLVDMRFFTRRIGWCWQAVVPKSEKQKKYCIILRGDIKHKFFIGSSCTSLHYRFIYMALLDREVSEMFVRCSTIINRGWQQLWSARCV